jgi:hypothetical protein
LLNFLFTFTKALELTQNTHFVFGGDCFDKGTGDKIISQQLVSLKKRFPDHVALIIGNRDINKAKLTSELAEEDLKKDPSLVTRYVLLNFGFFPLWFLLFLLLFDFRCFSLSTIFSQTQFIVSPNLSFFLLKLPSFSHPSLLLFFSAPWWFAKPNQFTFTQFLDTLIAAESTHGDVAAVAALPDLAQRRQQLSTRGNKMKWLYKHTMGSPDAFEYQRQAIAAERGVEPAHISDNDVGDWVYEAVGPNGFMREYLLHGQIGHVIGNTLFVHGAVTEKSMGFVPTRDDLDGTTVAENSVGWETAAEGKTPQEWIEELNSWGKKSIQEWVENPEWHENRSWRGGRSVMG